MSTRSRLSFGMETWPIWACRAAGVAFFTLGLVVLVLYARRGWAVDPESLPYSLRVPPSHAAFHLAVGAAALYVGFLRQQVVIPFLGVFALAYIFLGVVGSFTEFDLGLGLGHPENLLHWSVGLALAVVAFLLPRSGVQPDT